MAPAMRRFFPLGQKRTAVFPARSGRFRGKASRERTGENAGRSFSENRFYGA